MSRIGKLPIIIPDGINIEKKINNTIIVKGPLGILSQKIDNNIHININNNKIFLSIILINKKNKSLYGLSRSLINNMIIGVYKGFSKSLEIIGVGYKVSINNNLLELNLGFSHDIIIVLPKEIKINIVYNKGKNPIIIVQSFDKQLLGMVAAKIRSLRKPDPYKGKGIKYLDEIIRRKAGKSV